MDIATSIGVQVFPDGNERLKLDVSDTATVFTLDIVEALQSHSNKEVDENQTHGKHIEDEENPRNTGATSNCLVIVLFKVIPSRA